MKRVMVLVFIFYAGVGFANPIPIAQKEIGNGEIGGNNKGQYVQQYNRGMEAAWCAGFVSWVLEQDGYSKLAYSRSAKAIYNEAKSKNMVSDTPNKGDLIVFWRESPTSWKGHIGFVEEVKGEYIYTIEGNVGDFPAKVSRFKYHKNKVPKLLGYINL